MMGKYSFICHTLVGNEQVSWENARHSTAKISIAQTHSNELNLNVE